MQMTPAGIAASFVGADTETASEKSRNAQDKRIKEAEDRLKNTRLMNERDQGIIDEGNSKLKQWKQEELRYQDSIFESKLKSLSLEERRSEIEKQIATEMDNVSKKVEGAGDRVIHFQQQRLANEQAIFEKAVQANDKDIASAERKLHLAEQKLAVAEKEASSAQASFGLKTEEQQASILEARNQLTKDATALTVEQLQSLKGITKETDALVEAEAKRRANAAGFGAVFGKENEAEIDKMKNEIENVLKVEIGNLQNIKVQLEADWKKVSDDVAAQVRVQWDAAIAALAEKIKEQTEIVLKTERQMAARNGPQK
jgi:hypothetical protein